MGIKRVSSTVTYDMDMSHFGDSLWLYIDGAWRKQADDSYLQDDWYYDNYQWSDTISSLILICWAVNYLPGLKEWDSFDLYLTFDVDEVHAAGWTLTMLEDMLTKMRTKVVRGRRVEAEEPYFTRRIGQGIETRERASPAPLPLLDMLHNPHPDQLEMI